MPYTIDINTGGTFTDGLVSGEGRNEWVKVDTTPDDVTVGFFNCLDEAAKRLGFETTKALLRKTHAIRLSTTIAANTLNKRAGPKLGLIVTKGHKKSAYSELGAKNPALGYVIPRDMVVEISGKVDAAGQVAEPLSEEEVRAAVKELLVRGARVIVVSLLNSALNPSQERGVKAIVEGDYPKHYLGSVPVLLSTEVSVGRNDGARTNAALISAYTRNEMFRLLYKADDQLRERGYLKPLLLVHNWGGAARVAKTRPLATYGSGPAAGLFGAAFCSSLYNIANLVSLDIGGTSANIGLVINSQVPLSFEANIVGVPVKMPSVAVLSVGAGGGAIASVGAKKVKVGPESAGATPGPACYDLGGAEPTVADACLVLGYLNPDYFLGGRRKLNAKKASAAVKKVAQPLKLGVAEAAFKIVEEQQSLCARGIRQLLSEKGIKPQDVTLLCAGGAGGIFSSEIARALGIAKVYIPPFAAVFDAFGSSTMDVVHEYQSLVGVPLRTAAGKSLSSFKAINEAIASWQQMAIRDMRTEGFSPEQISFSLELELKADSSTTWLPFPALELRSQKQAQAIVRELGKVAPVAGEVLLESIKLRAVCALPHSELPSYSPAGRSPKAALKGKRKVFWGQGLAETPVYEQKLLKCGNQVAGPAVIEGEDTTILVPRGAKYSVDKFLFGVIEQA